MQDAVSLLLDLGLRGLHGDLLHSNSRAVKRKKTLPDSGSVVDSDLDTFPAKRARLGGQLDCL
jgi:hypothetical protein